MKWSDTDSVQVACAKYGQERFVYSFSKAEEKWNPTPVGHELYWAEGGGQHDFYGVFPGPRGDLETLGDRQDGIRIDSIDDAGAHFTARIPEVQYLTNSATPNFARYAMMGASWSGVPSNGAIPLRYQMACSIFRLTIQNGIYYPYKDIKLIDFSIEADLPLAGTYTGTLKDGSIIYDVTNPADGDICQSGGFKEITQSQTLAEGGKVLGSNYISYSDFIYKTLFVLPQTYHKVTVKFKLKVKYGATEEEKGPYTYTFDESAIGPEGLKPGMLHTLRINIYN